jgi:hypothetical protein
LVQAFLKKWWVESDFNVIIMLFRNRNTENENKRRKIYNKVLNMHWDYVRGKKKNKSKIKITKQKGNKQKQKEVLFYIIHMVFNSSNMTPNITSIYTQYNFYLNKL